VLSPTPTNQTLEVTDRKRAEDMEREKEKMWRNQKRIRTESVMTPKAIY